MNQDPNEHQDHLPGEASYEGYDEQDQYAYDQDDPYGGYGQGEGAYAEGADEGYSEEAYAEDEDWASGQGASEAPPAKPKSKGLMAALGALAVVLVGVGGLQMAAPEVLEGMNPMALVESLASGGEGGAEAQPDQGEAPAEASSEAEGEAEAAPPKPKPKPMAAKPKPTAPPATPRPTAKPHQAPPQAKPKPPAAKPVAAAPQPKPKPAPVAAKPKPRAQAKPSAGAPGLKQGIGFAAGSFWVAAAEMERLWAFSRRLPSGGTLLVEAWAGDESNGAELARKRADRVAELLRDNHGLGAKLKVVVHGGGPARRVRVSHLK